MTQPAESGEVQARARRQQGLLPIVRETDRTSGEWQVGRSALSRAAKEGHTETVGLLLDRKAEIGAADQVRVPHPHATTTRRCSAGAAEEQTARSPCYLLSQFEASARVL